MKVILTLIAVIFLVGCSYSTRFPFGGYVAAPTASITTHYP